MDYTVDSFVSKMIKAIIFIAILMMAGGIAFFRSYYAIGFALGVGMSLALNIGKVMWLKYCVNRATTMEPGAAGAYISIHYVLRYILTGLVLVAAHFLPVVSMFGAVVGLLSMPFANYVVHFVKKRGGQVEEVASDDVENENAIMQSGDFASNGVPASLNVSTDDVSTDNTEEEQLP